MSAGPIAAPVIDADAGAFHCPNEATGLPGLLSESGSVRLQMPQNPGFVHEMDLRTQLHYRLGRAPGPG